VAIWTEHNWTEGVDFFWQPFHDSELTIFESPRLHYRCFTFLVLIGHRFVPTSDGPLTPAGIDVELALSLSKGIFLQRRLFLP
jgi:hypothetical protein